MKSSAPRIAAWLRQQGTIKSPDGAIVRLELTHLPVGKKKSAAAPVHTIAVEGAAGLPELMRLAEELADAAERDADGLGSPGPQRYVVFSYRDGDATKIQGRLSFLIAVADDDGDEIESEPPTRIGLTAQLMRHLEITQRLAAENSQKMATALGRMVDSVSAENEKLRRKHLESIEAAEQFLSMHNDRELAAKKTAAQIELQGGLAKDLKLLVPALVGRLGGKMNGSTDAVDDTRTVAMRRFVESLSDEQRAVLAKELSPTQQIALMEIIQGVSN